MESKWVNFQGTLLGDVTFQPERFSREVEKEIDQICKAKLSSFERHEKIHRLLLAEIEAAPPASFLLSKVVWFITKVRSHLESYHFSSFELWLNHYSLLSEEEKGVIRGKIAGRYIPRSDYQVFFPVGAKNVFRGPNYSAAHFSPDIDTTVASFSAFIDAFAAKVGGNHYWFVPGGPPDAVEIDLLFKNIFGEEVFESLATMDKKLRLSSMDLLSHQQIIRKKLSDLAYDIDHKRTHNAVIIVDDEGYYIADWRGGDAEAIRAIVGRFIAILTEQENSFYVGLISLFARSSLMQEDVRLFVQAFLDKRLCDSPLAREFTEDQRVKLDLFLKEVLHLSKGYKISVGEFLIAEKAVVDFSPLLSALKVLDAPELIKNRDHMLLKKLEEILTLQKTLFNQFVRYIDTLEVALQVKQKVLGQQPHYLSHLAEYDEIMRSIGDYKHLTINYEEKGKLYPLGVIRASDLKEKALGTMVMRDFSNVGETDKPAYIDLISVLDHHKSTIVSSIAMTGVICDAQSSNSIIGKITMEINDRYAARGMTLDRVESSIKALLPQLNNPSNIRLVQRLLDHKRFLQAGQPHYVSMEREFIDYYQCLFAILDDTDLLTKVTELDVDAVAGLLNRMKSIMLQEVVEIVHFDDLLRSDPQFLKKAVERLVRNADLHSLYSMNQKAKENNIERVIKDAAKGMENSFFQDTKFLNGYARVGQFKHFTSNEPLLRKKLPAIREIWAARAAEIWEKQPEIFLHIFMLSTIESSEEIYADTGSLPLHYRDEIWFWMPPHDKRAEHQLTVFLEPFFQQAVMRAQQVEVLFLGDQTAPYEHAIQAARSLAPFCKRYEDARSSLFVLLVEPKSLKSRKKDIGPHL